MSGLVSVIFYCVVAAADPSTVLYCEGTRDRTHASAEACRRFVGGIEALTGAHLARRGQTIWPGAVFECRERAAPDRP